jgi:hypothetical protein
MIRRKAELADTGEKGWCLGNLVKVAGNGDQSMVFVFESAQDQKVTEQPLNRIKFDDGQPDIIPTFE